MEGQLNKPSTKVSLEKEETLWCTLQRDTFAFNHGENVHHLLLMLDEASNFAVMSEMVVHHNSVGANVDTLSVVDVLESSWIQYFGWPKKIRCGLEGAFRGLDLASYCEDRGIELLMVPAEHHQSTGDVERAGGILRHKMEIFLREPHDDAVTPRRVSSLCYDRSSQHYESSGGLFTITVGFRTRPTGTRQSPCTDFRGNKRT